MIPVFRPSYDDRELNAVREVFESAWIGLGPRTKVFEERFAEFVSAPFAVALNSATAALHIGLKLLSVEGGEVITTPMTFISTNHAILYNNAKPVFADIEEDTLNIRADEIERLITKNTKAVVVVHYGGLPCDMDAIRSITEPKGIPVLEDAAHACGAEYKGRKIGSISEITVFSFHAVKNLATGDGGMLTCLDGGLKERADRLRWLGINKGTWNRSSGKAYSWEYGVEEVGFKYHMNDITAAIGLVQLEKLPWTNKRRREISQMYDDALGRISWIELPPKRDYAKSAHHNYVIKVPEKVRDRFIEYMGENGIACGMHYVPNHLYDIYKEYYRKLPIAERVWKRLVTLPLFPDMTDEEFNYIVDTIKSFSNLV